MHDDTLVLATTTDFFGSYWPTSTSYGRLPGAAGLKAAVDRLHEQHESVLWLDTGDFAQGGPIAPLLPEGDALTIAAASLPFDGAVIGNHELDWGVPALTDALPRFSGPVLCANADFGLPATAQVHAGRWHVGIIGATHPAMWSMHAWVTTPQPPLDEVVPDLGSQLRDDGADVVVLLLHDGVDYRFAGNGIEPRRKRLAALIQPLAGHVDVVVGGHTLARHLGDLDGVPFAQPWAFGAEIGLVSIDRRGDVTVDGLLPEPATTWTGAGADLVEAARSHHIADLERPLVCAPGRDDSLTRFVAAALRAQADAHVGMFFRSHLQSQQSPIDGTVAHLPSGSVTEFDLLRLFPQADSDTYGRVETIELTGDELRQLQSGRLDGLDDAAINLDVWGPPALAGTIPDNGTTTVATTGQWVERLQHAFDRRLERAHTGLLRAAVTEMLESSPSARPLPT